MVRDLCGLAVTSRDSRCDKMDHFCAVSHSRTGTSRALLRRSTAEGSFSVSSRKNRSLTRSHPRGTTDIQSGSLSVQKNRGLTRLSFSSEGGTKDIQSGSMSG